MEEKQERFLKKLAALRGDYAKELPERFQKLHELVDRLEKNRTDTAVFDEIVRRIHSFSGSAVYFGYGEMNLIARECEMVLNDWQEREVPVDDREIQQLNHFLARLEKAAASPSPTRQTTLINDPLPKSETKSPKPQDAGNALHICLVEEDPRNRGEWELQLTLFGFQVHSFEQIDQLRARWRQGKLDGTEEVGLMLLNLDEQMRDPGNSEQRRFMAQLSMETAVMFTASRDDLTVRLEAVRMGGRAFLTKPIEINDLVDEVDNVLSVTPTEPFRILILEDEIHTAEHLSNILESAGFRVCAVTDPFKLQDKIGEFNPELVLLDYHLPQCTGLELAKVIRQQSRYMAIPIVFLSTEENLERHYHALIAGADDFLTKPISPRQLVISLRARLIRARALRAMMTSDSLTGLLNHSTVKQRLASSLKIADRNNKPLTFAMLDLDHFKTVNDTYGHAVGDRVLKSLACLLRQRLRRSDIIGRYGGEEFAVILLDTDAERAFHVMDEIRRNFARINHDADGVSFHVTFSCGLACFPNHQDLEELCMAADQALYAGKHQGRNRIVKAPPVGTPPLAEPPE
ncbi:Diguanylate cyclase [Sulfidibacter corallicola]|uniref:diguanylate cyclase n=1 Tax=Sulfidibacter corallicola TaxID=2818388 RepID=A0A8A4TIE1_SULCO|nr:diguanylate cyclase [Sulfidibacter corallicola]QTD48954.1 diguanylate cyclase [Sulfidibacter corallicola]